ncbi:hypothetical protein VTK73DRAFT_7160 [Phialemonium thermophilum]|uniref:Uncharacterized protein n=1 Tax=Phialemonium thermophilum TaxID=223376 RepID=A0ABR3XTK2_9PEZI
MGVNGLWTVVQPCARPTNLATLNRRRLAVDASIWIYQFLKAVRDKEGNALRNSHVVGFFRRICKLLWFGIQPVFVFDGGAPALKRITLQNRRRRREGRREDAARTAGKLLAVQMQRAAQEEEERNKRRRRELVEDGDTGRSAATDEIEPLPSMENIVYADELGMNRQERMQTRKFFKQDAYHLPELENGIEAMGKPNDPRIMSIDELEEYARQFHNGEDINLYDFSKIDFDSDFFKSLPAADRYNILNAARIRSRLRMGLSKDQLDTMFPDRMAFSKFQIERVKERNHLTQRLMHEMGMTGTDLTINVNARVAGEKNREYILVKNEGAEGGWALGVVSREKDKGEMLKPIDVDELDFQYQAKDQEDDWEDDEDFEDVPIEGLNRLPRLDSRANVTEDAAYERAQDASVARRQLYEKRRNSLGEGNVEESLFVDDDTPGRDIFGDNILEGDEDEDLNRAIAMSLLNQHTLSAPEELAAGEQGGSENLPAPQWTQRAAEAPRSITSTSGKMVAHIVNNRATAYVRRRESAGSSDSEMDIQTAISSARRKQPAAASKRSETESNTSAAAKNLFGGPLPFEKLDWGRSIFASTAKSSLGQDMAQQAETSQFEPDTGDEELAGGFERSPGKDVQEGPRPLPPWLVDNTDIRESVRSQQEMERRKNKEYEEAARKEEAELLRKIEDEIVEIESSEDDSNDIEIVEAPTSTEAPLSTDSLERAEHAVTQSGEAHIVVSIPDEERDVAPSAVVRTSEPTLDDAVLFPPIANDVSDNERESISPDVEFENIELPTRTATREQDKSQGPQTQVGDEGPLQNASGEGTTPIAQQERSEGFASHPGEESLEDGVAVPDGFDDFSDPEEEELLAQMAEEAEEHARFASQLNNKSEKENQESYERELRALRNQQKKDRRDADEVTQIMVTECQALLRLFGIPYVTAPMEAEAQCAELVRLGLVDGIVTDDSDTFLFGGTRVYKNMFNNNKFVECYLSSDLEKELSLSREQLISLAQLLGSDYTEGLPGIGPVTALEILSEFSGADGLEDFKAWWEDVQMHNRPKSADADSPFRRKFRKTHALKLFLPVGFPNPAVRDAYLHPEVDSSPEPFQWGVPNLDGLRQFLMDTIGWGRERTDEVLVPVIRDMNRRDVEGTQSNITRFFGGAIGAGAREAFAPRQRSGIRGTGSKRMADAVNRLRAKAVSGDTRDPSVQPAVVASSSSAKKTGRKRKARGSTAVRDEYGTDREKESSDVNGGKSDYDDSGTFGGDLAAMSTTSRARKNKKSKATS